MTYSFEALKKKTEETAEWLKKELSTIQTGRATQALLDGVRVTSYGTKMTLQQVGSITNEDARTLRIVPWDKSQVSDIKKAIDEVNLGVSTMSDDQGVRVSFPELTTETREKYVKLVQKKLEEARISLRQERDDVWKDIQAQEKEGEMSEDERKRAKDEMEKLTKEAGDELEALAQKREEEIKG